MKTKRNASLTGSLVNLFMAALILLATTACEKDSPVLHEDLTMPDSQYSGNVMTQQFWAHPEGGTVNLFDGGLEVIIPVGAVSSSTEFVVATFPVAHLDLDGYNMYDRGFSLQGPTQNQLFPNGITFKVKYDLIPDNWLKDLPANEEDLQIFWVSPIQMSYEKIVPVGDCCVDCNCKIVKGCIGKCGFYVVGEN